MTQGFDDDQTRSFATLTAGTRVSHYEIISKIGAGGMGEVYLAEDSQLDRKVALKFLSFHLSQDETSRARFTREAKAAAKLDHPNIVPVYEVGGYKGRPFFAMAYIAGQSLREVIKKGKLSIAEAIELTMQICRGLHKAHEFGVVHRDIKPGNIIIDKEQRARILDFGLATVSGEEKLTKTGSTLGTLAYMSPEQAKGSEVDHRSDLFSLGIVMYELVAARTPFKRETDVATIHAIVNEEPEPLARYKSDVLPELQRIVSKCLAKNPNERYQTSADLMADLRLLDRTATSEQHGTSGRVATLEPSIAVLPFTNMSADQENEYFADGLTEELLNVLARNPELKVIGRTSSFAFKGKQEDLRDTGQKLGVGTLLKGSIRKAGNRVRITAQLVNAVDGFHLWSESYDRVLDDIFAVQDDIAQSVATAMNVTLLGKSAVKRTSNPESYELVLRANQSSQQITKSAVGVAADLYQKAIDLDPDNAQAWAGLARAFATQAAYVYDDVQESYRRSKKAAQNALALDDAQPEAYEVMGWIRTSFEYHFDEAGIAFRKAYSLAPNNSRIVSSLSLHEGLLGRFEESLCLSKLSVELDPLNPETHLSHGRVLTWANRFDEARGALNRALELSPNITSANLLLSWTYLLQGKLDEALESIEKEESAGRRYCGLAMVYHAMGKKEESNRALAEFLLCGDQWGFQFAAVYAYRDEHDKAFEWLEKSVALRDAGIPWAYRSQFLKNLHADSRWPVFLKKIGFFG